VGVVWFEAKGVVMRRFWHHAAALLGCVAFVAASARAEGLKAVTPKDDGFSATGINARGDLVGFEWVEEKERPGVVAQSPILVKGKEITTLPLLKGYTATFPAAVSDDDVVVGRAGKPAPMGVRVYLRNQAFVWDAKAGIRGLGVLKDDWASFATGVSRDGRRVSGFSVGDNRVRACVWDRDGDGWKVEALPYENPNLGTTVVPISPDGRRVAGMHGPAACLWSRDDSGRWTREELPGGPLAPRGVNDAGTVVGVRFTGDGLTHAVSWSRAGGYLQLPKPAGYVRSEANAVNNAGIIVGMIDGPNASTIGPNAFAFEGGSLRLLKEWGPNFASATAINEHGQVSGVWEVPETHPEPDAKRPGK
jgi:uncharacterized membrane protein